MKLYYLSNLTITSVHARWKTSQKDTLVKEATSYLYTIHVRNPISRIVSGFNMCHVDMQITNLDIQCRNIAQFQLFYQKCFPTIEDLAIILYSNKTKMVAMDNSNNTYDCLRIATNAIQGIEVREVNTSRFRENYAFYANPTTIKFPQKKIFVVRTEYLWDDVIVLEQALRIASRAVANNSSDYGIQHSGSNDMTLALTKTFEKAIGEKYSHGSERNLVLSGLSTEGKKIICCYHSKDIRFGEKGS